MWKIAINDKVGKRLQKLPHSEQKKIKKTLTSLSHNPLPKGKDLKKLQGKKFTFWRIRVGDLRFIYTLSSQKKLIIMIKIDFRGRIY
ncbi:type II toxin-antitoxin system RelE/ParE family toxin [Candidatus Microgenomates bacterium]|nr:type II toxin-antitoxin system RelE/ParE family toxin [Candidatus Microgenomates bacterium]